LRVVRCASTLTLTVRERQNKRQELLILDKRDKRRTGPAAPCACCGKVGKIMARGLRESCYSHWNRYGDISRYPPSRKPGTYTLEQGAALSRAEQYRRLTEGPSKLSRKRACRVLGITERTGYRYEALFRAEQATTEDMESN